MRLAILLAALVALWLLVRKASGQGISPGAAMPDLPAPAPQPYGSAASIDLQRAAQPNPLSLGSDALDNITQAIYQYEGGHSGDLNVRYNNPGAVKGSSLATGSGIRGISIFADVGDGWQALTDWITSHAAAHPDWNFYQMFSYYLGGNAAAPVNNDQGNSVAYATYVANYAGVNPGQTVSSAIGASQ